MRTIEMGETIETAVSENEQARVIEAMTLAFGADPAVRWLYPDAGGFLAGFPRFARAFCGRAFEEGTAHYLPAFRGAALWLPPGVHFDEDAVMDALDATVASAVLAGAFTVFERMDAFHPLEPHWYLPLIGVDPRHQGRGLGSALLAHALSECDRTGTVAYLESSNPANLPLYERHGFRVIGEIQAGSSPVLYPMTRAPRRSSRGNPIPRERIGSGK